MKTFIWNTLPSEKREAALARPSGLNASGIAESVRKIMADVKDGGDAEVLRYTRRYDAPDLDSLRIDLGDCEAAWDALPKADKAAMLTARDNIEQFHAAQKPHTIEVETMPGVTCRKEPRAIDSAGLYVPGGTAPLVSTTMMLAIPAKVAGASRRVVVTPPGRDGKVNPAILAAAHLCGATDIFACGGAQAIAALAYGTETIPKCDKIFGPGNAYVATAKSMAAQEAGGPAIDLPAGPSEAMVIADDEANPVFVASDLLSQAEHDTLAQVICVATSNQMAEKISAEVDKQLKTLPRFKIAGAAMDSSRMFIASNREDILDIINSYAPEHLIIQTDVPESWVRDIRHAGSIFLGPWTPESVGDYASGTNHTLPTYGAAKAYSGVTLDSFYKYISVQTVTEDGLKAIGPTVERLAEMEELEAHKRAVSLRLETLS